MMKKKILSMALSLALVLGSIATFNVNKVGAQELTVGITPTYVNNIETAATQLLVFYPSTNEQNYKYTFEFTLSNPSSVRITGMSRYAFWSWGGTTKYVLSDSDNVFSAKYSQSWDTNVYMDHTWDENVGNKCDEKFVLDKGTYYLTVTTSLSNNFLTDEFAGKTIQDFAADAGFYLSVNVADYTKPVKLKSVTNKKGNKAVVSYEKGMKGGYQIQYSTNKKFKSKKSIQSVKTKATIKSLQLKKTYYVRVRAYRTYDGKKLYSKWSNVKKVKIKK